MARDRHTNGGQGMNFGKVTQRLEGPQPRKGRKMAVISDGSVGNYSVQVEECGIQRHAVLQRCDGGWWHTIQRELCPLSQAEALDLLRNITTVATPKYERLLRLLTEGTA